MATAIVAAAGQSRRMGGAIKKQFLKLNGVPVLAHSLLALSACPEVRHFIIVTLTEDIPSVKQLVADLALRQTVCVTAGGSERQYSIANALRQTNGDEEIILVHDGARPLVSADQVMAVIEAARTFRAAGLAVPVKDTIKKVDAGDFAIDTPNRSSLWAIQTPQAFEADLLHQAYALAEEKGYLGTDDASLVEQMGVPVKLVKGNYDNIKITTAEDVCVAQALLTRQTTGGKHMDVRMGIGYDVHRLIENRKLIIGGVDIPHTLGLEGHSDADVLLHAIKDALLGAAGMGDIGKLFPDTDAAYKGVSSLWLLGQVSQKLDEAGWEVNNVDATVVAQKPKLAPYIALMNENIAQTLGIDPDRVNVKATTTEGLGFAGRQEGISAYAVASLIRAQH